MSLALLTETVCVAGGTVNGGATTILYPHKLSKGDEKDRGEGECVTLEDVVL